MAPAGDDCTTAEALTGGSVSSPLVVNGTTVGYTNNYSSLNQTGCAGTAGRDRVYSVSLAPNARVLASIRQASVSSYDPSINVIVGPDTQCSASPRVCVAADDQGTQAAVNRVRYVNTTASTQPVFLLADSYDSVDTGGTYRLEVSVDNPTQGDACEDPIVLMSGTPRTGDTLTGFANDYFERTGTGTTCANSVVSAGVDRAYSVLVGAGEALTVNVTPSAGLDTAINLHGDVGSCSGRTCVTSSNTGAAGVADSLLWVNTGTTARTMLLVVESPTGATGTFSIGVTTGLLPGEVCTNTPSPITTPTTLTAQSLAGYAVDYSQPTAANACEDSSGPDRVYAVTVPARQRLLATVTGGSGLDPVINLLNGTASVCAAMPRVCSASADNTGSGGTEVGIWDNASMSPQNVFVVVSSYQAGSSTGTFSLNVAYRTGDHCPSASVVTGPYPRTISAESFSGYRKDINGGASPCRTYNGPDRVYAVTIPPRGGADGGIPGRMDFSATGSGGNDPVLNVYNFENTCTASTAVCLAGSDSTFSNGTEAVAITNPNTVPVTVFVGVSNFGSSPTGTYSVTVNVQ
jgi:hypothetical protein